MTQASAQAPHHYSRLVRLLSDFSVADIQATSRDFADRLGQLLGFADSIILADALKPQRAVTGASTCAAAEAIKAAFLQGQNSLVTLIFSSCTPGAESTRVRWPALNATPVPVIYEPYERFYLALQRQLDTGVRGLRSSVRDGMTRVSTGLAQLAALDLALEDRLWSHSRRFYGVIPRILEQRFQHLNLQKPDQPEPARPASQQRQVASDRPVEWQSQFCRETRSLLLAELELRLQPVMGLIEALDQEALNQNALNQDALQKQALQNRE